MAEAPTPDYDAPTVTVGTQTRHYLRCEFCRLTPMLWGQGFNTLAEAEDAAQKHREAHAAQPYCTCGTYPNFAWDDEDEDEAGHAHCRCSGPCCECGCLTKRRRVSPPGVDR